jgi:hypothetical protein
LQFSITKRPIDTPIMETVVMKSSFAAVSKMENTTTKGFRSNEERL